MKIISDRHFDFDGDAARSLINMILARPLFAHLATSSKSGCCESPVWYLWEESTLWIIGNYQTDSFPKRIERDSYCAIGSVDFDFGIGFVEHVGFRVCAFLQSYDEERMKRLLSRYLGNLERWGSRFIEISGDANYIFIRLEAETAVVCDQSYKVNGTDKNVRIKCQN
jgi:hypothetical protein